MALTSVSRSQLAAGTFATCASANINSITWVFTLALCTFVFSKSILFRFWPKLDTIRQYQATSAANGNQLHFLMTKEQPTFSNNIMINNVTLEHTHWWIFTDPLWPIIGAVFSVVRQTKNCPVLSCNWHQANRSFYFPKMKWTALEASVA